MTGATTRRRTVRSHASVRTQTTVGVARRHRVHRRPGSGPTRTPAAHRAVAPYAARARGGPRGTAARHRAAHAGSGSRLSSGTRHWGHHRGHCAEARTELRARVARTSHYALRTRRAVVTVTGMGLTYGIGY